MPTLRTLTSKAKLPQPRGNTITSTTVKRIKVDQDAVLPKCLAGYGGSRVSDLSDRSYLSAVLLVCGNLTGSVRQAVAYRVQQLGGSVFSDDGVFLDDIKNLTMPF